MGNSKSKKEKKEKKEKREKKEKKTEEDETKKYDLNEDVFTSLSDLQQALRRAGLEASQLIVNFDFTRSNEWNGGEPSFADVNLHSVNKDLFPNPYQQVLDIMCRTLEDFDEDHMIPTYGFGDSRTKDKGVFSLGVSYEGYEIPLYKLDGVMQAYNSVIKKFHEKVLTMSGPTSFAPLIHKAIEIVRREQQYHIVLIICDGAVDCEQETIDAIVLASNYPISIVCIGVGNGPWDVMERFDDNVPQRKFDNFQFVDFHKVMQRCENEEAEFAKHALMEIPAQYEYIKKYILGRKYWEYPFPPKK